MDTSLEHLSKRLSEVKASDVLVNRTQVYFVEALLRRIEQSEGRVKDALLQKADNELNKLGDVKLSKAEVVIESSSAKKNIQALTQQLYSFQQSREHAAADASFESSLFVNESDMVNELTQQVSLTSFNEPVEEVSRCMPLDSGAMRLFRESLGQVTIDKRVSKAIDDGPDNPGPFNPQGLTIRALTRMRDVSPEYLHRFVGLIDTLLSLQQIEETLKPQNKTKKKK